MCQKVAGALLSWQKIFNISLAADPFPIQQLIRSTNGA
jgi:hypothetical protein